MGFSVTGSHVIFFVAALIVAGTVSGIFVAVTTTISGSFNEKGKRVETQLDTEFSIINDPEMIPISDNQYIFYIRNTGSNKITTSNETMQVFIDGEIIITHSFSFSNISLYPSEYTTLHINSSIIAAGYHQLRVVGPCGVDDDFTFKI